MPPSATDALQEEIGIPAHVKPYQVGESDVICAPGDRFLSGGCRWGSSPGDVTAWRSEPYLGADGEIQGWSCIGIGSDLEAQSGNKTSDVTAYAVCAEGG